MLVREPELLVFDDLSSALDVETEQKLWSRVLEQREPTSINLPISTYLVVSHRPIALRHADNIVVLKDGKIEAEGTLEVLLETCEERQGLWRGNTDVVRKRIDLLTDQNCRSNLLVKIPIAIQLLPLRGCS